MILKSRRFAFALAALGLFACLRDNDPGLGTETPGPGIDTLPEPPSADSLAKTLSGCWTIAFRGLQGGLDVRQSGKDLAGSMLWADGSADSLSGILDYPYLRLTTEGAHGPRSFRGNVLPIVNHFEVKLMDTPNRVVEKLIGDRGTCPSPAPRETVPSPAGA